MEVSKALLENGAAIEAKDNVRTLHLACSAPHSERSRIATICLPFDMFGRCSTSLLASSQSPVVYASL